MSLRAGGRWSHPFLARGVLFADASVGVMAMGGTGGPRLGDDESGEGRAPVHRASRVPGWRRRVERGPRPPLWPAEWAHAPGRKLVSGNLGGLPSWRGISSCSEGGSKP